MTAAVIIFYHLTGEVPGADVAKQLVEAIKAKKDIDDFQTILNSIPANATGQEDLNPDGNYHWVQWVSNS